VLWSDAVEEAVIIPASSVISDGGDELEPVSKSDYLLARSPCRCRRLKPFGQLKLAMAGPETMMFAIPTVDTGVLYPGSELRQLGQVRRYRRARSLRKSFCAGSMWNSSPRPDRRFQWLRIAYPLSYRNRRCAPHPLSDHQLQHGRRLAQMDHQYRPAGRKRDFNTKLVGLQIASPTLAGEGIVPQPAS